MPSLNPCIDCNITTCRANRIKYTEQRNAPILLITRERYRQLRFSGKDLNDFRTYYNNGVEKNREYLFIDENPGLIEDSVFLINDLNKLLNEILEFKNRVTTIENSINETINHLKSLLDNNSNTEAFLIESNHLDIQISEKDQNNFASQYYGSKGKLVNQLKLLKDHGGLLFRGKKSKNGNESQDAIYLAKRFPLALNDFATFIFDGTASVDPSYDDYCLTPVTELMSYRKLHLNIKDDQSNKSQRIEATITSIDDIIKDIQFIKDQYPNEKLLIITTKAEDFEKNLKSRIDELNIEGIEVDHYQNLRSTNKYREIKVIYFTHINQKPWHYYISYAGSIYGKTEILEEDITCSTKQGCGRKLGFNSPHLDYIRCREIVTDLIQCIYRTNMRERDHGDIHVYIGITDITILMWLFEYFDDAEVDSWTPK